MAGWGSTLPAAIDALVATFTAMNLADVSVTDGPALTDVDTIGLLTVGYSAEGSDLAASAQTASEGLGGGRNRESYDVYCSASVLTGDEDQKVTRDKALSMYSSACEAVHADPTLGGVVMRATPGDFTLHQSATTRGRATTVQFAVSVDAYTA